MYDLSEVQGDLKRSNDLEESGPLPSIKLVKKQFAGKFAISSDEFTSEMVSFILSFLFTLEYSHLLTKIVSTLFCLATFNIMLFCNSLSYNFFKVGAKSRNIAYLKGKVPSWVGIPTSVALPFGSFEKVLSDELNKVLHICKFLSMYTKLDFPLQLDENNFVYAIFLFSCSALVYIFFNPNSLYNQCIKLSGGFR